MLADRPAVFEVGEEGAVEARSPWYEPHSAGKAAIASFGRMIEDKARRQGVDPDLVKAVVFAEKARGHCFGAAKAAEGLGLAKSYPPMNIRPDIWSGLGLDPQSAQDPGDNICAGVTLLKRLSDRAGDASIESLATLWNSLAKEQRSEFGAYVRKVYDARPWRNADE